MKLFTKGTAPFIVLFLLVLLVSSYPAVSEAVTSTKSQTSIFEMFNERPLYKASEQGLTVKINKSTTHKGITLTVNEVYKSGQQFFIAYTLESNKHHKIEARKMNFNKPEISINEKPINYGGLITDLQKVSENKYVGIIGVNRTRPTTEIPNNFNIKYSLSHIYGIPGHWELNFRIKSKT